MTFQDLSFKLARFWWLIVLFVAFFTIIFLPWLKEKEYLAEIQVGANFNSPILVNVSDQDVALAYVNSLTDFSSYLKNRFQSVLIQKKLAEKIGLDSSNLNLDNSFYEIKNQDMGFVLIQYKASTEDEARHFLIGVKEIYTNQIIPEWNISRQEVFKIEPMKDFQFTVISLNKSKQFIILPSLIGFLVGLTLVLILPLNRTKESSKLRKHIENYEEDSNQNLDESENKYKKKKS